MKCLLRVGVVCAVLVLAGSALAQDPVKVAPGNYKTLLENDHVRVCEVSAKPGEKIGTHSHPDHAVYVLAASKIKFSYPDGTTKDVDNKVGEVKWIKAETHSGENVGTADFRAVVVELRDPAPKPGEATQGAPAAEDQAKVSPDTTKVIFENERLRVLETNLKAGGKLPMHSHPPYVIYSLNTSKSKSTTAAGKAEERELAAGKAIWSDAIKHSVENVGGEGRVILFELKQPAGK